jgi:hypothetical protein
VIDRPALERGHIGGDAMTGEPEDETVRELGVPVRQPLGVAATGGDAHHGDPAPPQLVDDRGVVVGDVDRRAAGWEVGPATDLDEGQIMPRDRIQPAFPRPADRGGLGRFVGELGVPVYYYEDAATRPERKSLPDIRKGEYEALEAKLQQPEWAPDEGPAAFNARSGALVTGARFPLIAFNVNLRTTDVSTADRIAKAVRHVSGGYRYVRAMGLALEEKGLVQVSMNLINYTKSPIPRVLETIRAEASRYGVTIAGTELVGPVPLGALEEVARYYLQVHDFSTEQIIELALVN